MISGASKIFKDIQSPRLGGLVVVFFHSDATKTGHFCLEAMNDSRVTQCRMRLLPKNISLKERRRFFAAPRTQNAQNRSLRGSRFFVLGLSSLELYLRVGIFF